MRPPPRRHARTALLLLIGHLALTLWLSFTLGIWQDEAFSLDTTSGSAARTLHQALFFELQPPFYFLLLWAWRRLADGYVWARLLSVACATAALATLWTLARRHVGGRRAAVVLALLAAHPFVLWYATEIRVYALALLLASLLTLAFHDAFLEPQPRRLALTAYPALAVAGIYTQYYLAVVVAAHGAAALLLHRRRAIGWLALMLPAAMALAPLLLVLPRQVAEHTAPVHDTPSLLSAGRYILDLALQFLAPTMAWADVPGWLARPVALAALALAAWRWRRWDTRRRTAVVVAAAAGLGYALIAMRTGFGLLGERHLVGLYPVLVAVALAWAVTARTRTFAAAACGAAILVTLASWQRLTPLAKPLDAARVAAYIAARERPGDVIITVPSFTALALRYHYAGANAMIALPRPQRFDRYDLHDNIVTPAAIDAALSAAGHPRRAWLVMPADRCRYLDVDFGCGSVEAWVASHARIAGDAAFAHSQRVRLLEIEPHAGTAPPTAGAPDAAPRHHD